MLHSKFDQLGCLLVLGRGVDSLNMFFGLGDGLASSCNRLSDLSNFLLGGFLLCCHFFLPGLSLLSLLGIKANFNSDTNKHLHSVEVIFLHSLGTFGNQSIEDVIHCLGLRNGAILSLAESLDLFTAELAILVRIVLRERSQSLLKVGLGIRPLCENVLLEVCSCQSLGDALLHFC